jgi:hypothetical protein
MVELKRAPGPSKGSWRSIWIAFEIWVELEIMVPGRGLRDKAGARSRVLAG